MSQDLRIQPRRDSENRSEELEVSKVIRSASVVGVGVVAVTASVVIAYRAGFKRACLKTIRILEEDTRDIASRFNPDHYLSRE